MAPGLGLVFWVDYKGTLAGSRTYAFPKVFAGPKARQKPATWAPRD